MEYLIWEKEPTSLQNLKNKLWSPMLRSMKERKYHMRYEYEVLTQELTISCIVFVIFLPVVSVNMEKNEDR